MGRPAEETETMTTSKAVLALCLVGAAVAAPQLRLGGLRSVSSVSSVTNQDEVVTNVVSALTPSIAAAVEEAWPRKLQQRKPDLKQRGELLLLLPKPTTRLTLNLPNTI